MSLASQRDLEGLLAEAESAREAAYAPYSRYPVGAALLGVSGRVYRGCNVENASFGLTVCAERNAVGAGVLAGEQAFAAVAVATAPGGPPAMPCGACRQVLAEFGRDMRVVVREGDGVRVTSVADLLPHAFGPADVPGERGAP